MWMLSRKIALIYYWKNYFVQPSLSNMPLFMMLFYPILVVVFKKADLFRARMVWQGDEDKKYIT